MAEPQRRTRDIEKLPGIRVLIVEAPYYEDVSAELRSGAERMLTAAGVDHDNVEVPGALEIPQAIALAVAEAAKNGRPYDGAIALGCVIRGETSHYDIVAGESARALMDLAIAHALPIGNGILTVDTHAQAMARAGLDRGDKGGDAARAALSLVALTRRRAVGSRTP